MGDLPDALVGGKDDAHPIEWVRQVGGHDAVEVVLPRLKLLFLRIWQ